MRSLTLIPGTTTLQLSNIPDSLVISPDDVTLKVLLADIHKVVIDWRT
jgi:hypothetical protein